MSIWNNVNCNFFLSQYLHYIRWHGVSLDSKSSAQFWIKPLGHIGSILKIMYQELFLVAGLATIHLQESSENSEIIFLVFTIHFFWHKLTTLVSQAFKFQFLFHSLVYHCTLMSIWWGLITLFKDYYKILEVDYDATDEKIRLNYRKLALVSGSFLSLSLSLFSPSTLWIDWGYDIVCLFIEVASRQAQWW